MHCVKAKLTVLRNIGVCAASVTWRRGGKRGSHAGQPLCNKCGVWEFRHPDSPPRLFVDEVSISTSTLLVGVAVGTGLMQIGMETCMVCCPPPPHSLSISVLSSLTFHVFSTRLAYPILSVLLRCK